VLPTRQALAERVTRKATRARLVKTSKMERATFTVQLIQFYYFLIAPESVFFYNAKLRHKFYPTLKYRLEFIIEFCKWFMYSWPSSRNLFISIFTRRDWGRQSTALHNAAFEYSNEVDTKIVFTEPWRSEFVIGQFGLLDSEPLLHPRRNNK